LTNLEKRLSRLGFLVRPSSAGRPLAARQRLVAYFTSRICEGSKMTAKRLNVQDRKDIFYHLVHTQDSGSMSVSQSRQSIIKEFAISDAQLREIEEEGLEKEWPPLDEAIQRAG
jgi:hypothetical protein